jgi:hypothetical protein
MSADAKRAIIIAVIPMKQVPKMRHSGWRGGGKTNGLTETMFRVYPSDEKARLAGYDLPYTYGIERCPEGIV